MLNLFQHPFYSLELWLGVERWTLKRVQGDEPWENWGVKSSTPPNGGSILPPSLKKGGCIGLTPR